MIKLDRMSREVQGVSLAGSGCREWFNGARSTEYEPLSSEK